MRERLSQWWPAVFVACAIIGFTTTVIGGVYLVNERRKENTERLNREAAMRRAAIVRQRKANAQIRFVAYVLCRSGGRSPKQCDRIAAGVILSPNLTLDEIEARLGKIAELRVSHIFVKGQSGLVGRTGPRGLQGIPGATGSRGAAGGIGARGSNGSRGARGPPGPQGSAGPAGPQGPPGAPGTICVFKLIRIPASGEYWICIRP
jgi:Collagen triple helix repeat (20 copies)